MAHLSSSRRSSRRSRSSRKSSSSRSKTLAKLVSLCAIILLANNGAAYAEKYSEATMNFAMGQQALNSNQIDKCKEYIALLKKSSSGALPSVVLESRMLSKKGNFKEAIALLSQAIKSNPNNATLLSQRAQVYGFMDDEKQSCLDYFAASKCSTMNNEDCLSIVRGLSDYDKWVEALDVAQIGIKKNPPNSALYAQAGDVARKLNKLPLAEEYLEKALAIGPARASNIQELASLHRVMKKWPAVIADCKKLKASIANADSHVTYGRCLEMSGEAHIELKQYEEAVADLSKASKISPLKSSILKLRATAYEKQGKKALAQKDLAAAKQIDNSF